MKTFTSDLYGKRLEACDLPGAEEVAGILRQGTWARLTCVWRAGVEVRVNGTGELERWLVLDLGESFSVDDAPLLRVEMRGVRDWEIPDEPDIIGLVIDDISEARWEGIKYRLHDYEGGGFYAVCANVRLSLEGKPGID